MSDKGETGFVIPEAEMRRIFTFIGIQVFFLLISPLTGGLSYKVWSMLDSAILVLSIGLTGLMLVLEQKRARQQVFKVAVVLHILAVLDMSINIVVSGWVGWGELG